jgi:uncharacterized protein YjiS (DUF1127 family)
MRFGEQHGRAGTIIALQCHFPGFSRRLFPLISRPLREHRQERTMDSTARNEDGNMRAPAAFALAHSARSIGLVTRLFDLIFVWRNRARQRRHLAELDDRLLRDIGISSIEVEHEISLPFWRSER